MNVYICNKDINKGTIISENTYDISDLKSISDFIFKGMTSVSIDELNKSDYNGAKGFSSFIAKTLSSGKNIKNINIDVYFISNTK